MRYVQVSPAKAPQVVGALLDVEAPDDFIGNLILSIRSLIPVEALCAEVCPAGVCLRALCSLKSQTLMSTGAIHASALNELQTSCRLV